MTADIIDLADRRVRRQTGQARIAEDRQVRARDSIVPGDIVISPNGRSLAVLGIRTFAGLKPMAICISRDGVRYAFPVDHLKPSPSRGDPQPA